MWTDQPKPLWDGTIIMIVVGLVFGTALKLASVGVQAPAPSACQEVVVVVERRGNVLAKCPAGTTLDIVGEDVVCRCMGQLQVDVGPDDSIPQQDESDAGTFPDARPGIWL